MRSAHLHLLEACTDAWYTQGPPSWLRRIDPATDGYLVIHGGGAVLPVRSGRAVACLTNQQVGAWMAQPPKSHQGDR